jgi:hypothetical protein
MKPPPPQPELLALYRTPRSSIAARFEVLACERFEIEGVECMLAYPPLGWFDPQIIEGQPLVGFNAYVWFKESPFGDAAPGQVQELLNLIPGRRIDWHEIAPDGLSFGYDTRHGCDLNNPIRDPAWHRQQLSELIQGARLIGDAWRSGDRYESSVDMSFLRERREQ